MQHLEGYDVAPGGEKEQSTGEYVVTKDNIGDDQMRELFDPDLQSKRKIETPTYKKK